MSRREGTRLEDTECEDRGEGGGDKGSKARRANERATRVCRAAGWRGSRDGRGIGARAERFLWFREYLGESDGRAHSRSRGVDGVGGC